MSDSSIPTGTTKETPAPALFGFAIKREAPGRRPCPKRKPPLRSCGDRHWPKVCPRCLEVDPPARLANLSQLAALPGETWEDIFGGAA